MECKLIQPEVKGDARSADEDDLEPIVKLFCFPHAGGGAHSFKNWVPYLEARRVEVKTVPYAGRGSRMQEPLKNSMEELVQDALEWMQPEMDRPFMLLGHSMGGLVAFEVAKALARAKMPPPFHVFISSVPAPSCHDSTPPLAHLSDEDFVTTANELGWFPQEAIKDLEFRAIMLPTLRADIRIYESYRRSVTSGATEAASNTNGNLAEDEVTAASVPLTVLGGDADRSVELHALESWGQVRIPASRRCLPEVPCRIVPISGAGHFHITSHASESCDIVASTADAWLASRPPSIVSGLDVTFPEESYCLHELFFEQARQHPDRIVLIDNNCRLTYREVEAQVLVLARLLQEQGVGVGMDGIVGILASPSVQWVVAKLAILTAGGAVLPFYVNYTNELISDLVANANVRFIMADPDLFERIPQSIRDAGKTLVLDSNGEWLVELQRRASVPCSHPLPEFVEKNVPVDSIAMLSMTSGSTGKPKAIIVSHYATVFSFAVRWASEPFQENEITATNIFFVWEVLRAPLKGFPTHIVPDDVIIDPKRFLKFLKQSRATRIVVTAQLTKNLLEYPNLDIRSGLQHMRRWYLCGEVCLQSMAQLWQRRTLPSTELWNYYSACSTNCKPTLNPRILIMLSPLPAISSESSSRIRALSPA